MNVAVTRSDGSFTVLPAHKCFLSSFIAVVFISEQKKKNVGKPAGYRFFV